MKYGQKRNELMRSRGGEIDTHQVSNRRANFGNGQGNRLRNTNFPCVYCAEPNHRAHNCRHGQAILCHSCNWLGHKSKYCSWGSNRVNHENTTNGRLSSAYWEHANEGSAHRQGLLTETDKENNVCHNVLYKHKCEYFKNDFLSYTNPFIFMSPAFNACTCTGGEMKSLDCKQMSCIKLSVEKALENGELWIKFTIARSPADGHCFVHSLIRALRDQHPDSTMANYAEVLRLIVHETKQNILSYTAFNIDQRQKRVLDEMERYIKYKIYDCKYGDMVPLIASTALSLTHWGRVTHICVIEISIIGSDNGLSPGRRQTIICTSAGILFIGPLGTNFSENLIGIQAFSFKKMHFKMASTKWRPFCLGPNVLNVFIISKQGNGHDVFHVKPMSSDDHTKAPILLYKEGEHYDAIVPLEKHYDQKCFQKTNHIKDVILKTYPGTNISYNYDGNAWCNHRKNAKNISQNRNEMTYSESKPFIMKLEGFLVYMLVQAYYNRSCSESSVVSDPFPETDKGYIDELKDFRLKHPKNVISGHLNINSLRNKFLETTEMLMQNYLDIVFLSETKTDHSYPSAQFHIPDFKCHRADRNEHGGGLICYIRNNFAHRRRADLEYLVPVPVEFLIIEVIVRQEKWLFVGMYNPSYSYKKECCAGIENVFDACRNEKMATVFLVGDLNIKNLHVLNLPRGRCWM